MYKERTNTKKIVAKQKKKKKGNKGRKKQNQTKHKPPKSWLLKINYKISWWRKLIQTDLNLNAVRWSKSALGI